MNKKIETRVNGGVQILRGCCKLPLLLNIRSKILVEEFFTDTLSTIIVRYNVKTMRHSDNIAILAMDEEVFLYVI